MEGASLSALMMGLIGIAVVATALYVNYQDKHPKPPASKAPPR